MNLCAKSMPYINLQYLKFQNRSYFYFLWNTSWIFIQIYQNIWQIRQEKPWETLYLGFIDGVKVGRSAITSKKIKLNEAVLIERLTYQGTTFETVFPDIQVSSRWCSKQIGQQSSLYESQGTSDHIEIIITSSAGIRTVLFFKMTISICMKKRY